MTKMNEQTVYTTLPGSSTLEVESIERVPVYEPAERKWIRAYFHKDTITVVDENGKVTRTNVTTGEKTTWLTRPKLQDIVTMSPGGYYYEFRQDGSILSSCKKGGVCYWGPIQEVENPVGKCLVGPAYRASWEYLMQTHFQLTDPIKVLDREISDWWDCQMDKRWRRSTSLEEETEDDRKWLKKLKYRLENDSRIYSVPTVRKAYEEQIKKIESRLA